MDSVWGLLSVVVLVAINGFFVAAEFSLVRVRKTRIEQLVDEGKSAAKLVQAQLEHLDTYIAATQLGITLASLALGWVGEPAVSHLIEPLFEWIGGEGAVDITNTVGIIVSFLLITTFHIVLGELVPKSVALQRSEGTALLITRPLALFARIFRPFIYLMNSIGNGIVRMLGLQAASEGEGVHTVEELEILVAQSREAGVLDQGEEVMLRRVFDFGEKTAQQVMMPRTEIVGVSSKTGLEDLIELSADQHYTRFPIYEGNLDHIIGAVHVKDLVARQSKKLRDEPFLLSQILRPILVVPQTVSLEELLSQMRSRRVHMAQLVDEYGGTAGLVTLEDILEEIIGEVRDEFDLSSERQGAGVEVLPNGTSLVSGLLNLADFSDRFKVEFDEPQYDTIAGYILHELSRAPKIGDSVRLDRYQLSVEKVANMRIVQVKVTPVSQVESTSVNVRSSNNH